MLDGECKECYNQDHKYLEHDTICISCNQKSDKIIQGKCYQCLVKISPLLTELDLKITKWIANVQSSNVEYISCGVQEPYKR